MREAAGLALAARPRALELEARVAVGLNEARVHNEEAVDALGRAGVAPTVTLAVAAVAHQRAGERSKVQVRPATTLLRATALAEGTRPVHGRAPRPCGRPIAASAAMGKKSLNPADAQRKKERQKEIKKNKANRTAVRSEKLFNSPEALRAEIDKWRRLRPGQIGEDGERLDPASIANRIKKLEESLATLLRQRRVRCRAD